MVLRTLKLLVLLIVLVLPLGQFSRLPLPIQGDVKLYLNDLLLPALITVWLCQKLIVEKSLKLPPLTGRAALFAGVALVSLLNGLRFVSPMEWLVAGLYLMRWIGYAFLYLVVTDLVRRPKLKGLTWRIVQGLLVVIGLFALTGLLQFILFPDFSRYVEHGWDPHYYRVLSTFFDPNFAGMFLTFGFLLGASLLLTRKLKPCLTLGLAAYLVLLLSAVILTFSRSSYLAFLIGVSALGLLRSRRLLILIYLTALLAFLFIPKVQTRVLGAIKLDQTAHFRLENWQKTARIIRDHSLLGVGFNTYRYVQEDYGYFRDERGVNQPSGHAGAGADSSLLFVWATTGVFGLLVYLGFLAKAWQQAWGGYKQAAGIRQAISLTLVAGLPAWLIHSQFVNSLFYPWLMEVFWFLLALI